MIGNVLRNSGILGEYHNAHRDETFKRTFFFKNRLSIDEVGEILCVTRRGKSRL